MLEALAIIITLSGPVSYHNVMPGKECQDAIEELDNAAFDLKGHIANFECQERTDNESSRDSTRIPKRWIFGRINVFHPNVLITYQYFNEKD